jgi:hypothetical protein
MMVVAMLCGLLGTAQAKGKSKKAGVTAYTVAEVDDVLGVITISEQDGDRKAYSVNRSTRIMVNGAAGKVSDIKAGMRVSTFAPVGPDSLGSITVTGSGAAPTTEKKKPDTKRKK